MEFRPCIDIHNGKVKQIVGDSLQDGNDFAKNNFVALQEAAYFARLYKEKQIKGGHVILLNSSESAFYHETKTQAINALKAYPQGLQVGGGMNPDTALEFIEAGASHIIVTSYVFKEGQIKYSNLEKMVQKISSKRLVLDLSCRKKGDDYIIVTDRWQKETTEKISKELLEKLSEYCDEFLVHAVDVEGKSEGIEEELVCLLGDWVSIPTTYAGGVHDFDDLHKLKELGKNKLNVTIGSALDLFGGTMSFEKVLEYR